MAVIRFKVIEKFLKALSLVVTGVIGLWVRLVLVGGRNINVVDVGRVCMEVNRFTVLTLTVTWPIVLVL